MSKWMNATKATDLLTFPPLYSPQVRENQEAQFKAWSDILVASMILDHSRDNRVWSISLQEYPRFTCSEIQRSAPIELRRDIIDYMVQHGRALWIGSSQRSHAYILMKNKKEYEDTIYEQIQENMVDGFFGLEMMVTGIEYTGCVFYGMPVDLFDYFMQGLVESKRAITHTIDGEKMYKLLI